MLLSTLESQLPQLESIDYRSLNNELFNAKNSTCFILDDDPTGNQTVYGITLLASWDIRTIENFLKGEEKVCFILTNSRSLSEKETENTFIEVMTNITKASKKTGLDYTIISRSDSTLRGHFPLETNTIQKIQNKKDSILFLLPMMFEGGRMTHNDTHYICNKNLLTPVNESPFAKDHTFGYTNANLKHWIEEKTLKRTPCQEVLSFSIEDIRNKSTQLLAKEIQQIAAGTTCIANAISYLDLDKFCNALLLAEQNNKAITYRTSSSFIPSYIGLPPIDLLSKETIVNSSKKLGGLIVVGSYVSKTSKQLAYLKIHCPSDIFIELGVDRLFSSNHKEYLLETAAKIENYIHQEKHVILYTSRDIKLGNTIDENINIGKKVSEALIKIVASLETPPNFLVAKGGITSHDIATKALKMEQGKVIGQALPGVPVWEMNEKSKFSNLHYIVFPGNVGDETSLFQLMKKIT